VTFTGLAGLPGANSAFGRKAIVLSFVGVSQNDTEPIEVFFPPISDNNSGPAPDDIPETIDLREVVVRARQ
jgi:hypothetical protein